jgi:hypothetical protein
LAITIGGIMLKNKNKKPVRNQNRTVGVHAVEVREVEVIKGVEEVSGVGKIEDATEGALEDIFLPDYGGSD